MAHECNQNLIVKEVEIRECRECRACNCGIYSGGCECTYYDTIGKEYWCEKCGVEVYKCYKCSVYGILNKRGICKACVEFMKSKDPSDENNKYEFNEFDEFGTGWHKTKEKLACKKCNELKWYKSGYYDTFKGLCETCVDRAKNNDPSDENNKYEFKEPISWEKVKVKCTCTQCGKSKWYNVDHHNENPYICSRCKIKELKSVYKNCKFSLRNNGYMDDISFKKECICGKYTNSLDIESIDDSDIVVQCSKCDPSTEDKYYEFNFDAWELVKISRKCDKCETKLWKSIGSKWGDITQCADHKQPTHNHIKFRFSSAGYVVDKIKVFNKSRHSWKKSCGDTLDYVCPCEKCCKK